MNKKVSAITLITGVLLLFNVISCSKSGSSSSDPGTGGGTTTNPPPASDCSGTPGPLFTIVKDLVTANCLTCHNNSNRNGDVSFTDQCTIVEKQARMKVRVVDEGSMPQTGPLPQVERDKITAWIKAGGRITD